MKIAIIDLGTNTFNLLIALVNTDRSFTVVYEEKKAVKIGQNGINRQYITDEATERALDVLLYYRNIAAEHKVDRLLAFATSAVRSADNMNDFLAKIKQRIALDVQVISGDQEAELIYYGVRQTLDIGSKPMLILDIGGGSNEFIIANKDTVYWKHSFPLGMARAVELFPPENPLDASTMSKLEEYFDTELDLLWTVASQYSFDTLLGSSGSFDTYRDLLTEDNSGNALTFPIALDDYQNMHNRLVKTSTEQRLAMPGMKPLRVEMIVYASVFINLVLRKLNIPNIIQSSYALKEGALFALIHGCFPKD